MAGIIRMFATERTMEVNQKTRHQEMQRRTQQLKQRNNSRWHDPSVAPVTDPGKGGGGGGAGAGRGNGNKGDKGGKGGAKAAAERAVAGEVKRQEAKERG